MLAAALLTALTTVAGTLATYLYDRESSLTARLAYGAVSGLAVFALVALLLANVLGIVAGAAASIGLTVAVIAILAATPARARLRTELATTIFAARARISQQGVRALGPILYAAGITLLVWLAFERVIIVSPDGIATGYVNNLGDLPFHMHLAASFAYSANFPPSDPTFWGTGLTYPYIADFFSGVLLALDVSMTDAFLVPNFVLGLALVVVLHSFTYTLTGNSLAAMIAPVLVLLSGGLGWLDALGDARAGEEGLLALIGALPQDYTINGDGYRWGNAITTLLVTQRSMLFGLSLSLMAFTLLWKLINSPPLRFDDAEVPSLLALHRLRPHLIWRAIHARPEAFAAAIFTGMLPLVHAHSFLVVIVTAFVLGLAFRQWREGRWLAWAVFVVVTLAIALPETWLLTRDSVASAGMFFGIEVGWDRGNRDPVTFWLLNAGLFIPVSVSALAIPVFRERLSRTLVLFSLPFFIWFLVPNVIRLAPWVWDNIKVLIYWYVGLVPIVALFIAWLLRDRIAWRVVGLALLLTLVLAGSLDVWRVISGQTNYMEFDRDGIAIADAILRETPPDAVVLHAPTWNTPAYLTGRQSLLGYTGYVWAHGLDYAPREEDIKQIYAGAPTATALLDRYGVDYILVTPLERDMANEDFLARFPEVARAGEYRLLEVTP